MTIFESGKMLGIKFVNESVTLSVGSEKDGDGATLPIVLVAMCVELICGSALIFEMEFEAVGLEVVYLETVYFESVDFAAIDAGSLLLEDTIFDELEL